MVPISDVTASESTARTSRETTQLIGETSALTTKLVMGVTRHMQSIQFGKDLLTALCFVGSSVVKPLHK